MVRPPLQRLLVNLSHKIKWVKQHGRNYLVAPMTLINPGVLNGSKGPLLYPPEEVASRPQKWNGVPIVVYHPHRLGQPVSAAEPGILDSQGVGEVRNATSNGKLQAEGWFDVQKMQKVNPVLLQRLLKNEAIELSTGLYTDNEERSGTFNGRPYTAIARNYKPDHLAILPDQTGACSIKDGCGVLVNKNAVANAWSDEARQAALTQKSDPEAVVASLQSRLDEVSAKKASLTDKRDAHLARAAALKAKLKAMKRPTKKRLTKNQEFNMNLQNKLSLLVNADPDCIDEENCNSKEENCDTTENVWSEEARQAALEARRAKSKGDGDQEELAGPDAASAADDDITSKTPQQKFDEELAKREEKRGKWSIDADEFSDKTYGSKVKKRTNNKENSISVTLKTDSPTKLVEPSTLKAAIELHDLITGAAESPLKQECLKASEKFLKKFQAHLDASEEENKDTEVEIQNAWSEEARQAALEARRKGAKTTDEDLDLVDIGSIDEEGNVIRSDSPTRVKSPSLQKPKFQLDPAKLKAAKLQREKLGKLTGNHHIQEKGGQHMAKEVKLSKEERKAVVDGLIVNEGCCWEESDREVLNTMNDTTLAKLHRQMELVANAEMSDILGEDDEEDVAVEEEKTKKGDSQADGKVAPTGDLDPGKKGEPATNALSEQDRRDLAFARHYRMAQRKQHIGVITANANNKFTSKQLESMDDGVLANMALLANTQEENNGLSSIDAMSRPNFFGAQGAAVINAKAGADEEPLMLGRIDYKELAANNGRK